MQQVISLDRKKYAVGLVWQPLAVGLVARNYAHQLINRIDKKLNLFIEYRSMLGLGSSRAGHKRGMSVAATEVTEAFAEYSSFLAAFKIKEGFWLVSVRNGVIIKDALFEDEQSARAEYIILSNMPDWGALFAPESWGMPRSIEKVLDSVIFGTVKATLKPISKFHSDLLSFFLIVIFIAGFANFFKEPIHQMIGKKTQISKINPELAAEYKKQLAKKNQELDEKYNIKKQQEEKAVEPITMPYDLLPNPVGRAQLCYQAIGFLMQPVNGWNQKNAECNESDAKVTFKRSYGNMDDFYEVVTNIMPGVQIDEKSDSEIVVTTNLPLLEAEPSMEEKDAQTLQRQINSLFQKIKQPVDTGITVDTIGDGPNAVDLNVVEISAESKLIPTEFIKIFDEFSGVYMTMTSWDYNSRTWNYEVIIYAK